MGLSVEGYLRWSCQARGKEDIYGCGERGNQMIVEKREDKEDRERWRTVPCISP